MQDRIYGEDWVSQLKSKADIVNIISSYIPLTKKGSQYWGCCPFHHEKTPSFTVNPAGQFYHCFGCSESGDVIKFIEKFENIEFMDACKVLAEKVGFEIPEIHQSPEYKKTVNEREEVSKVLKDTAVFYNKNLSKEEAKPAQDYIKMRGFDNSTVVKFGMGYSPDYDSLPTYLKLKNYTDDIILKSGVCGKNEKGGLYDALAGRLIIPIINIQGKVIAFGGRLLTTQKVGDKYKNTRNSAFFVKNKNLYAINNINKLKKTERVESIIMVEGYMDVISLNQAGIYNVVASMGTSLTQGQAALVKRFCDKVYVAYDGDTAGQMATLRSLDIFASHGLDVMVIQLDEGKDPDEIIKEKGKKYFLDLVYNAKPLIDYKLLQIEKKYGLNSPDARAKYASEAIEMLREVTKQEVREVYLNEVCKKSQIQRHRLQMQLDSASPIAFTEVKEVAKIDKNIGYLKACRIVLLAMLNNKPYAVYQDISKYLSDETHIKIFDYIKANHDKAVDNKIGDIFNIIPENEELKEVLNYKLEKEKWENEEYKESLQKLKTEYLKEQIAIVTSNITKENDITLKRQLLNDLLQLRNELKNIK